MFNAIVLLAAILFVAAIFGAFCSFAEWADREGRVPFFVLWYMKWNHKEGLRRVAAAKERA